MEIQLVNLGLVLAKASFPLYLMKDKHLIREKIHGEIVLDDGI